MGFHEKTKLLLDLVSQGVMRRNAKSFLLLITLVSLAKCVVMFSLVSMVVPNGQRPAYYPDSLMYETLARNILMGDGFSLSTAPPYQPTMVKEPLYPTLMALFKAVFGDSLTALILLQIALNPLIAILVYVLGKEVFDVTVSRLAALLIAVIPLYGDISYAVMPEAFFMVLFLSTIVTLLRAVKLASTPTYILSGVLLGFAALCKNVLVPLALLYPIFIILPQVRNLNRQVVINVVLFVLSFSVITTPWMWRNQQQLGLFSISVRGGALFSHQAAWAAQFTEEEWKAYALYVFSGKLSQKAYPQVIGSDLGDYEYGVLMRGAYVDGLLQKHKEGEVERMLVQEGVQNLMQHPVRFLALSSLVELQTLKYLLPGSLMAIRGPAGADWLLPVIRAVMLFLGIILSVLTVIGIFRCRHQLRDCALLLTTIIYFHVASASLGIIPGAILRYVLPVTVLYSYFIVIAVVGTPARMHAVTDQT